MRNKEKIQKLEAGFTLMEIMAGIAIFIVLAMAVLGAYSALTKTTKVARLKTLTSAMAAKELEVVRNIAYTQIGTVNGNPHGSLPDQSNPRSTTLDGVGFRVYFEVTYIDDSADGTIVAGTDSAPNDYKQIKMFVFNTLTSETSTFLTNVSPKGLEGLSNAGALLIKVFDAVGQPISGVSVSIANNLLNPTINLQRTSDASGQVLEVGLPASVNGYHLVATKNGYTTAQTYPASVGNPNPINPDATIVDGVVTKVSLQIDLVSTLNLKTLNQQCQGISGVNVNVKGEKLIGTNPDVLKYDQNHTSIAGLIALNNLEWDTYIPILIAGQPFTLLGTNPVQQITVLPNTTHTFTMILGEEGTGYSLLVLVKDSATGAALQGATVHLVKGGSVPQDYTGITGGSVWLQDDWTAGSGQVAFTEHDKYFADDGNVDINSVPTGVRLRKTSGRYALSGTLESSTFDTGTNLSDYSSLVWQPTSQDPAATLKFQIASNNDNTTWNYLGPDGTANTYYTVSGTTISSNHDNNRYVRYKAFLSTTNDKKTPILTDLTMNYVSGCYTPGQISFMDLTQGQNYDLDISATGYQTFVQASLNITGNQVLEVLMSP